MPATFAYSNRPVRPTGPVLRALSAVVPGIGAVQTHVLPYAHWWEGANARALASGLPLWVALGDSMTQGVGASAPDRGWVGQLSARLTAAGWEHAVVNLSVTGARLQDVVERQVPALGELEGTGRVALVTVVAGSNDVVLRRHRRHLVGRTRELLDALPRGAVVSNLPNPHRAARQMDALLRRADAAGELVLADMRREGPRSWRGRLASDAFHPNDAGYAGMADVVENAVRRAGVLG